MIGYQPGGVVVPRPVAGRSPQRMGEAMVDQRLDVPLGTPLRLAGRSLTVVGTVSGLTYNGGTPTVVVTLRRGPGSGLRRSPAGQRPGRDRCSTAMASVG